MRYFLIAGEASGDLHGAHLIEALRRLDADAEIAFLGGDKMAHAASVAPVIHIGKMAYMGFSEVLRHLNDINRNMKTAKQAIAEFRPDALILIDYPGFNLSIAKYARSMGISTFYYIPPKVWAWKEYRVKQLRRYTDEIFSILPFETEFYAKHQMRVEYVGNPSVAEVDAMLCRDTESSSAFCRRHGLDDAPILALIPGSRVSEIRNNLWVMTEVASRHPQLQAVIAGTPDIPDSLYRQFTSLPIVRDATMSLMHHARAALVTSGTATLECALAGTPQVACYRSGGSRIAYAIMSRWLKIRYVTLPNLIVDAPIIPEMLLHHCNPEEVDRRLRPLLADTPERTAQLEGYARMRRLLGTSDPALATARSIYSRLTSLLRGGLGLRWLPGRSRQEG